MLPNSWRLEKGSIAASVLILSGLSSLVVVSIFLANDLALSRQRLQLVADHSALIASETTRGMIAGYGCQNAEEFAKTFDISMDSCRIVSFDASVELADWVSVFPIKARATAGSD